MTSNAGANKKIVLIITTTTGFILPFLVSSVTVALPVMAQDLKMEAVVMSWVTTAYFLPLVMVQVPFGRLSDMYGRKKLFLLGTITALLASLLGGFANSVPVLLISRALQGLGSGTTLNNSVAMITSVFPKEERAKALGISQSGVYLGLSLGPFIGGVMTEHLGWHSIFLVSAGACMFLIILTLWGLKAEWHEAQGEKFDVTGTIAYMIAMALFMYGFSSLPDKLGMILFAVGLLGMVLFVWWELKTPNPVFNLSLFRRNRVFMLSNIAALTNYSSTYAITFLASLYLQYILGMDPSGAGIELLIPSLLMTIATALSGYISQRYHPRLVATAGLMLNCAATIMLIFLGDASATSIWYIRIALYLYGIGNGLFVSPNTNVAMGSVEARGLAVASGTLGTMRNSGMLLSMGITMILFSLYIGGTQITSANHIEFLASAKTGFIVFSIIGFCGVIAQMVARRSGREPFSQ
jgi:MFS family permease